MQAAITSTGSLQNASATNYVGRFAPSPTGPLHLGSLVAAMASYLDAKVHRGQWLLRIEDNDFDRNVPGAADTMIATLQRCGMHWDGDIIWQSQRTAAYQAAFAQLGELIYPCACSRKEIADSIVHAPQDAAQILNIYPGTCRDGIENGKPARAYRLRVPARSKANVEFIDRWAGHQQQNLADEVGDFVVKRADGFWAYQLAVVVDDAAQGVTDIVRGADLLDSTARQIYLQSLLGYATPRYVHLPVVNKANGEKLSKQTGAVAFDKGDNDLLHGALLPAAAFLQLELAAKPRHIEEFWQLAALGWERLVSPE
jgi:glutamyl-Q tRNA(Asp) synthetase